MVEMDKRIEPEVDPSKTSIIVRDIHTHNKTTPWVVELRNKDGDTTRTMTLTYETSFEKAKFIAKLLRQYTGYPVKIK